MTTLAFRALGLDPDDLGHDVDTANETVELYHHDGALVSVADFDGRDPDSIRAVADWFDQVATVAYEIAGELRDAALAICEDCGGHGVRGDDSDCRACGGTGRAA